MAGKWVAEDNHIAYSESGILRRMSSEAIIECLFGDNPETLPPLADAFPIFPLWHRQSVSALGWMPQEGKLC